MLRVNLIEGVDLDRDFAMAGVQRPAEPTLSFEVAYLFSWERCYLRRKHTCLM